MYLAMVALDDKEYEDAQDHIDIARETIAPVLSAMLDEHYNRAYAGAIKHSLSSPPSPPTTATLTLWVTRHSVRRPSSLLSFDKSLGHHRPHPRPHPTPPTHAPQVPVHGHRPAAGRA